ncbi:hypothetical protein, partial [Campylobacter sp. 2457A]|uniref:hypothetical protein n=2 Tax=unclassified Campylobacter TaxID=2593542 RepID=UPI00301BBB40|nr:hypothetical protein [Campylobacter sp. 2457A]
MQSINLDRRKALKNLNQIALLGFGGYILLKQNFMDLSLTNEVCYNDIKLSSLEDLKSYIKLDINLNQICKEAFIYKDYELLKEYFLNPSLYYNKNKKLSFKELKLENKSLFIKAPKSFIKALENLIKYDNNSHSITSFIYQ